MKASNWRHFSFLFILVETRKSAVWKTMTHTLLLYCLVFLLPTESWRTLYQVRKGEGVEDELVGKANGQKNPSATSSQLPES